MTSYLLTALRVFLTICGSAAIAWLLWIQPRYRTGARILITVAVFVLLVATFAAFESINP